MVPEPKVVIPPFTFLRPRFYFSFFLFSSSDQSSDLLLSFEAFFHFLPLLASPPWLSACYTDDDSPYAYVMHSFLFTSLFFVLRLQKKRITSLLFPPLSPATHHSCLDTSFLWCSFPHPTPTLFGAIFSSTAQELPPYSLSKGVYLFMITIRGNSCAESAITLWPQTHPPPTPSTPLSAYITLKRVSPS